jgi:putative hemolysin
MRESSMALAPVSIFRKISVAPVKTVKVALEKLDAERKLHHYKIRNYRSHVVLSFERGNFVVKTAENGEELEECLRLRYEVFHREFKNRKRTVGVDIDKLDEICDHLLIRDKRSGKVIGTYRLNSSRHSDVFYSANEFHMEDVLALPGNKLELGRACIDREYRNGVTIALLWRGIAEYIQRTDTQVLFGCASIKTMEPLEIGLISRHLETIGAMEYGLNVTPTKKYKVRQFKQVADYIERHPFEYQRDEVDELVPTLFKSYLKAGVKVCGEPAIDREFRCIDYLIVLKMDEMNPLFKGKYKV